jgi:hypothetical protein
VTKRSAFAAVACLLLCLTVPVPALARANDEWQGQATPHFAIYTPSQDKGARELLGRLEVARIFFEKTGLAAKTATPQLSILALGSTQDADVFRVNPAAYAFYQRTREGDFVVMRDLAPEHLSVAVHEYTHFVVEHAGLKLPLWLNEGVADLYSTVEANKAQVLVGAPPVGREATLNGQRWIDWQTLTAVDQDSPYYRQPSKMLLFYAQSWALVHMLALDSRYEADFPRFLETVSGGVATDAAMRLVYGKTLEQIGQDLAAYLGSKRMSVRSFNIDARPSPLESGEIAGAGKCVELALADILASNPQLAPEANRRLVALSAKYADDPHPEETLGFQSMRAGMQKDALDHFARAVRNHSQNPEVWFRLAHLKLQSEGPTGEVVGLLERVIASDGDHYGARLELGFAAAKNQQYELAVKTLEGIDKVKPEHAYVVSYTLAYCLVENHQGNRARLYAEQARQIAAGGKDHAEISGLLRYIEQETPVEVASR